MECPSSQSRSLSASKNSGVLKWLVPHVSLMFSERERVVQEIKSLTSQDALVDLKDSLHTLLLSAAGVEGQGHFRLCVAEPTTGQLFAVIFVADFCLDLGSHTVVVDAWVAPATTDVRNKLNSLEVLSVLTIKIDVEEAEA
ncbi:hypothetical protein JVU11DRAFT_3007 [Chiua virens]|nr:hypothetical protein JVU11DRAFT_3007 [Chiua virens]